MDEVLGGKVLAIPRDVRLQACNPQTWPALRTLHHVKGRWRACLRLTSALSPRASHMHGQGELSLDDAACPGVGRPSKGALIRFLRIISDADMASHVARLGMSLSKVQCLCCDSYQSIYIIWRPRDGPWGQLAVNRYRPVATYKLPLALSKFPYLRLSLARSVYQGEPNLADTRISTRRLVSFSRVTFFET